MIILHHKKSARKKFLFCNMCKKKRLRALLSRSIVSDCAPALRKVAARPRELINENATFRFFHKAFAKSLAQNLRGPTLWANY